MEDVTPDLLRAHPLPSHDGSADKQARGQVLAVGGGRSVPGALLLAGVAALRAGAGKLQLATVASVAPHLGLAVPECLALGLPETDDGEIDAAAARAVLEPKLERCDALIVGPGMLDQRAAARLALSLTAPRARVIDAAALCALAAPPGPNAVLTPHDGEMAKLMRVDAEDVAADRPGMARDAARRFDAVVALKGGETIVAAPDGRRWRYRDGRVGLATSGSGDTLAGLVGGLLARGAEPVTATLWAVHLHGEAGNRLPPLGFLARELLDQIPRLLAERA